MHQALTRAQDLTHPFSLAFATSHTAFIHQLRREVEAARVQAEVAIPITTEQNFPLFWGYATLFRGWARSEQGEHGEGIAEICQGVRRYRSTGQANYMTYFLAILAEAYGKDGQMDNAMSTLNKALLLVDANEERYYEAELHRLRGQLLLQQAPGNQTESEACFHQAITIAQNQSAKSWELRTATSLAKLWQSQGKRQEAYDLLAPIYGWFTEGFDTADLIDAKTLLDELK